ncbi:MAG TPA: DivIVA domain-containing protein [Acidimicrobiales bacterium]|nr:DivIVA domain-containing protein [Acidimicrobiales bacterium]
MPEERLTITTSSSRLHPDDVARHTFGTTRRGFDPAEVRSFLEYVARELAAAADREQELRQAVAEAEHRAANPVLDDATLTASLGQETARVLRSAHDAAAELLARAESDAAQLRSRTQEEAEELQHRSEQSAHDRGAQAAAAAAELRRRAEEEANARVESAQLEADALVAQAREECRAMVQEAQELRSRVLADLTRRRRVLHSQIEQLRAGRERLAQTVTDVRSAVDAIADDLFRAEDQARLAAEMAGRQAAHDELEDVATPGGAALPGDGSLPAPAPAPEGPGAGASGPGIADPGDGGEPEAAATRQSVEELFARLRAGSESLTPPTGVPAVAGGTAPGADDPAPATEGSADEAPGEGGGTGPVAEAAPAPPVAQGGAGDDADAGTGGTARDEAAGSVADVELERRDEVLLPMVELLARRLKRALQDDQNDILARLRAAGGWAPGVLAPEEEHAGRFARAALDPLAEAGGAGAAFAGGKADEAPAVEDVAGELAGEIVAPLRRRLDSEAPAIGADEPALVELVGAAFREWKGARVERLAGDKAVLAFARAALAAVPSDATLRWIVDDEGSECPDCDDNALAGPVRAGEEFPTGHRHPPAHAGCRCLLAPPTA